MKRKRATRLLGEAMRLLVGLIAFAIMTGVCFWLHATVVAVSFTFLILIVFLCLFCSLTSLVVFSVVATGCLNYFFTPPLFSFRVDYPQDVLVLLAFFITALVITGLVKTIHAQQDERVIASERLRETQAQLAHAGRLAAVGQMTASIGHELKQPIGATINNAEAALLWLQHQPPELDEAREALHDIVLINKRAVEIIERIRTLLKKTPAQAERVELNGAIEEVVELARGEIVKNGVSLRLQLADRLPFVQGDRIQLQQVVLNLVINAVEAMSLEPTRELVISTNKADPSDVIVAVQDLGCGLSEVQIARLFDLPFHSTKPDGLGLGLSICHLIIGEHGGRLWATPNLPRGTTFQFTLPAFPDN